VSPFSGNNIEELSKGKILVVAYLCSCVEPDGDYVLLIGVATTNKRGAKEEGGPYILTRERVGRRGARREGREREREEGQAEEKGLFLGESKIVCSVVAVSLFSFLCVSSHEQNQQFPVPSFPITQRSCRPQV
jgi:hypothetical protein